MNLKSAIKYRDNLILQEHSKLNNSKNSNRLKLKECPICKLIKLMHHKHKRCRDCTKILEAERYKQYVKSGKIIKKTYGAKSCTYYNRSNYGTIGY